jgi:hypothetical protein
VVDGPARGRADVERAKAAATATTAATAATPDPDHWRGSTRCPVCLEDWDENGKQTILLCCCKHVCSPCFKKMDFADLPCPLCRTPYPETDEVSLAMLRRHVENDNPVAIRHLGECYQHGKLGFVPSHKKAARLYQRAVELGDVTAMCNLGTLYTQGEGVKLDKKKMVKYWRMAADRGCAIAQSKLGVCLLYGDGVTQDITEGLRLQKLAANQGLAIAEYFLGVVYQSGLRVARDPAEAIRWFERAAARGCEDAKTALVRLRALGV